MAAIFLSYPLREVLRVFHLVGQVLMNMVLDGISTLACGRSQRSRGRGLADHRPGRDHVDLVADGAVHVASHGREGHGRNADPRSGAVTLKDTRQPVLESVIPLFTVRAASEDRYLIGRGVAPQRARATGFADTRPLTARDNPVDSVRKLRAELTMERLPDTGAKWH